jgi:hypothetical protein
MNASTNLPGATGVAVCVIPNCGKSAPPAEPFCASHRKAETPEYRTIPYAYCCAQGGGNTAYCDCVNKDHGTARIMLTKAARP